MKKSIILKSFLVILVSIMLVFTASSVYAATSPEDEGFEDMLTDNETSNSSNTNSSSNSNSNSANTNTNTNSNVQNLNALRNNATTNSTANTTNTLPKTGIQDSLPTVLLIVIFAVSAIYAYKKIKDYRSID